jgi:hypothetical protein
MIRSDDHDAHPVIGRSPKAALVKFHGLGEFFNVQASLSPLIPLAPISISWFDSFSLSDSKTRCYSPDSVQIKTPTPQLGEIGVFAIGFA